MNEQKHINPRKEETRNIAVGWSETLKAFFACFFDETIEEITSSPKFGVYFGMVNRLDDLGDLISRCGTIPESSLEKLKTACAEKPLPAAMYWLLR